MLVVYVHARVRPERVGDEQAPAAHKLTPHYAPWRDAVAEMTAEPRQSFRYSVGYPAGSRDRASAAP